MSGSASSRRMCASMEPHIRRVGALAFELDFDLDLDFAVLAGIVIPPQFVLINITGRSDDSPDYGADIQFSDGEDSPGRSGRAEGGHYSPTNRPTVRSHGARCSTAPRRHASS